MTAEAGSELVSPKRAAERRPASSLEGRRGELVAVARAEMHEGPLPHPDHYERYAAIIPDGANRIMRMAEKEQGQRHLMERMGTISAFVLSLAFLFVGGSLVREGHDAAGATIVTSTVPGLAGVFITGRLPDVLGRGGSPPQNPDQP